MGDANDQRQENERFFEEVKRNYITDMKTRFGFTDLQATQAESLANWAFDSGFGSGFSYARYDEAIARLRPGRRA
ncbi:hypothetical protein ACFSR7_17850 [Cohnella sp. GCM10020058]|uniref:hypothetical protein n=1 Tax=Cohnella sp. GCM10020058 TaxID=3317330 RepID=UPI003626E9CA